MRAIGDLVVDGEGCVYFAVDTSGGVRAGAKLCRIADGVVWFWDKQARLERGFRIDMFADNLARASDAISRTGEAE